MLVKELKELLDGVDENLHVMVTCEEPPGMICPDGCAVDIDRGCRGIDWHGFDFLLIPHKRLYLKDDRND